MSKDEVTLNNWEAAGLFGLLILWQFCGCLLLWLVNFPPDWAPASGFLLMGLGCFIIVPSVFEWKRRKLERAKND
jgi:hypothetical protein